jgi:tRNA threonylcarbamoyladenosine biosynthesis protein TsaE
MEIITKNAQETFELGRKIGSSLKGGETLAFIGGLGVGKTTFIQGLAKGIGVDQKVISPTFILMRSYRVKIFKNVRVRNLYHLDLYRLEGAVESELINLGIEDIWKRKENIVVIEWADKATGIFPKETIWIKFENIGDNERKIRIEI